MFAPEKKQVPLVMISGKNSFDKILIIDDEADICFLLKNMLSQKNYNVSSANTLSEGYSKIDEYLPSLLFLDLNLPDGSGLDAIGKIKKKHPTLKIVVISAYDSPKERNTAKEEGADYFVSKPFNKEKIYESLNILAD
jgi:DNA-binding response OmpR family regulator